MNIENLRYLSILFVLALMPCSAFSAPAAGGSSWYRVEGGISLSGEYGSFDETKSGTVYENSLYGYSIGGLFRTGLRFNSLSVGIAGAIDGASGALGRRTAETTGSNPSYDYAMLQVLAGGFVGVTLWGDANGPELIGEYYAAAHRTVSVDKATTNSPFQPHDALNGQGWGAGISFTFDPRFRFGLMYRSLVFDKLNLSGTADPVTRTDLQLNQGMIFISRRL